MTNRQQYQLIVGWQRYFNTNNRTVYTYLSKYGNGIISQMHTKLKTGIRSKSPYIILLKFENSDIITIVHRYEYETVLHRMLELCISMEYYELCGNITETLKSMNRPKRKTRIKSDTVPV